MLAGQCVHCPADFQGGGAGVPVLTAFAVLSGERQMQEVSAHSGQRVAQMHVGGHLGLGKKRE